MDDSTTFIQNSRSLSSNDINQKVAPKYNAEKPEPNKLKHSNINIEVNPHVVIKHPEVKVTPKYPEVNPFRESFLN